MRTAEYVIEATILAIATVWVLTHATAFSTVVNSTSNLITGSAQSFWTAARR